MLYDKRWDKTTKADPFTLESLIAWLEKQPADRTYHYTCQDGCLLAEYFRSAGFESARVTFNVLHIGVTHREFPDVFRQIAIDTGVGLKRNWTFGVALERARAALIPAVHPFGDRLPEP